MLNFLLTLLVNFAAGDAVPPQMILDGGWTHAPDGLLIGEDGASFHVDAALTDFTYQIEFTFLESGTVHLVSRASAENPCEGFQVVFTENEARLSGVSGSACAQENTFSITPVSLQAQTSVRMELVGSQLTAYLNDEFLFSGSSSRFPSGGTGLVVNDGARIAIAAVSVEPSRGTPGLLADFAAEPQAILAELQFYDLVPAGGRMLFEESHVFVRGGGYNIIPLAERSPRADVVLGGELSFRRGDNLSTEACVIAARADRDIEDGITLRLMDSGAVMLADQFEGETGAFEVRPLNLNLDTSHHILMIVTGDEMTVYVDGQLLIEALPVAERAGIFALAGRGNGLSFRCDVFDMWVYSYNQ